jgi:tetratricopeptide (TPR) repeat protein
MIIVGCGGSTVEKRFEQSKLEVEKEEYDKAISTLEEVASEDKENSEVKELLTNLKEYKKSVELYKENKYKEVKEILDSINKEVLNEKIKEEIKEMLDTSNKILDEENKANEDIEKAKKLYNEKKYTEAESVIKELNKKELNKEVKETLKEIENNISVEKKKAEEQRKAEEEKRKSEEKKREEEKNKKQDKSENNNVSTNNSDVQASEILGRFAYTKKNKNGVATNRVNLHGYGSSDWYAMIINTEELLDGRDPEGNIIKAEDGTSEMIKSGRLGIRKKEMRGALGYRGNGLWTGYIESNNGNIVCSVKKVGDKFVLSSGGKQVSLSKVF